MTQDTRCSSAFTTPRTRRTGRSSARAWAQPHRRQVRRGWRHRFRSEDGHHPRQDPRRIHRRCDGHRGTRGSMHLATKTCRLGDWLQLEGHEEQQQVRSAGHMAADTPRLRKKDVPSSVVASTAGRQLRQRESVRRDVRVARSLEHRQSPRLDPRGLRAPADSEPEQRQDAIPEQSIRAVRQRLVRMIGV